MNKTIKNYENSQYRDKSKHDISDTETFYTGQCLVGQ